MITALTAFLISGVVALVLTPLIRSAAARGGVVDVPGGRRAHARVTPRLGGVAVLIAFLVPFGVFAAAQTSAVMVVLAPRVELVVGLVIGSIWIGAVGAWDDIKGLGPGTKLLGQAGAALVAYGFGFRIEGIDVPFYGEVELGLLALPVTMFWFLGVMNALNLIDGLDGLAAGIALFATVSNGIIAFVNESLIVLLLSASLAGALVGFLRYNFNPATIFLGDSGSLFIGYAIAAVSLAGATLKSSTTVALLAPIIALGVPLIDTTLAMVRRALAKQSIFAADRGHLHHRLVDMGITHRRVVLLLYSASVLLAASAIAVSLGRNWQVGAALIVVFVILGALVKVVRPSRAQRRNKGVGDSEDVASSTGGGLGARL